MTETTATVTLNQICKSIKNKITITFYNNNDKTNTIECHDAIITVSTILKDSNASLDELEVGPNTNYSEIEYAFSVPHENAPCDCYIFTLDQCVLLSEKYFFEKEFGPRKQQIEINTDENEAEPLKKKLLQTFLKCAVEYKNQ